MAAREDYYDLLGVGRKASVADIKKAYRKKAKECHPDHNPGDKEAEQRFRKISEAYEVLGDSEKRAAYDRFGHRAFEGRGPGAASAGGAGPGFSAFSDIFEDLFGDLAGRTGGRRSDGRGADLRFNLEISLEEAWRGGEREIRIEAPGSCESCGGLGAADKSDRKVCDSCKGSGRTYVRQGHFVIDGTCTSCQGSGHIIRNPCRLCQGTGRVVGTRTLRTTIPQGIDNGARMRLEGKGEAGIRGGPPGDLYLFVSVAPHRLFRRDGRDVYCRIPVPMTTAALGGTIEAPMLDGGRASVNVPEGAQNGQQLRMRGKGMPQLHGGRHGDMYIVLSVETPTSLTEKQKEILRSFDAAGHERNSPESHDWLSKIKEFFQ